jgi:hypothetical protein
VTVLEPGRRTLLLSPTERRALAFGIGFLLVEPLILTNSAITLALACGWLAWMMIRDRRSVS